VTHQAAADHADFFDLHGLFVLPEALPRGIA
jgi:hypothetical protein